ncbi:hypothetical protein HYFRA_00009125 [Hymenoscyphus fraxineus]|uniref:F-box domain-containing protein n=1 Tax=Hymenoscyphus fraxineus TaxID=746836 RepID=A0A9N9KTM2_9HELO|nr:hypothetical protein HYFRA_00009125 [Hymenoscyphus fraxineus]
MPETPTDNGEAPSPLFNDGDSDLPSAAATKALSTPEILAVILHNLEFPDLLTICLRVNRYWKAVIDDDPAIQKKLYFMPEREGRFESGSISPVVQKLYKSRYGDIYACLGYNLDWKEAATKESFLYPNATWRKMLLVQPPLRIQYGIGSSSPKTAVRADPGTKAGVVFDDWKRRTDSGEWYTSAYMRLFVLYPIQKK